ncbi:MAG: T9SS type A sorting domain-containing protein [Bacteroidetes bacterium]|nr:T9SS type A sorting domain-containing protein [Bacteroidota bacterium]
MKRIIFVLVLLIAQLIIKAQAAYDSLLIGGTSWGGVAKIKDVLIDNSNNVWIAYSNTIISQSGLKRFDGTTWTQYQTTNSGLSSNFVNCVVQDSTSNYWIGTNNGLTKFDGTNWTIYNTLNSGIAGDVINSILLDADTMWLATNTGVSKFFNNTWVTYNQANSGLFPEDTYSLLKHNDTLYIGKSNGISILSSGVITNFNQTIINSGGNGFISKIIYNTNFGITFCTNYEVYQLKNDQYINLGDILNFCIGSLNNQSNLIFYKSIQNGANGELLVNKNGTVESYNNSQYGLIYLNSYSSSPFSSLIDSENNKFVFLKTVGVSRYLVMINPNVLPGPNQNLLYYDNNCGQRELNINQVKARVLPLGDMFWDINSNPKYEVPKGSGSMASFGGSIWIGGKVNNQLRTACQTYRQNGIDFWPGSLDTTDAQNPQGIQGGKIIKVNRFDIENFIYNFNQGNVQSGNYLPSTGIMYWPAHDTGNCSRNTAPFVDVDNNGMYNPLTGGDYPKIKGDQELYNIYNDASGQHLESGSSGAMGIEIHQSSYAYTCDEIADSMSVLNYTTFYEFEIINRSDTLIDSMYVAFWNDVDLGNYQDDYVGCNVNENYGYVYNGDNYDDDGNGVIGYHEYLPCFSTAIIESPKVISNDGKDNNHNGLIDEQNEDTGMSSFIAYNNTADPITGNPSSLNPEHYYNYMQGKWKDGSTMKYGGTGTNGTIPTTYQFPSTSDPVGYGVAGTVSNPNPQPAWTETTAGNVPGDRRFLIGSGPFQLAAKDTTKIVYAMVFTIDSAVTGDMTHNIIKSESDVRRIKAWYRNNNFPSCLDISSVSVKEIKANELSVKAYPNPTTGLITIQTEDFNSSTKIVVIDLLGKTLLNKQMYSQTEVINMSQYESGIYFIKVYDNLKQKTIKIIKS